MRSRPDSSIHRRYALLLLSLVSGFFLRDFIPTYGLTLQPVTSIHPSLVQSLKSTTPASNIGRSQLEQTIGETFNVKSSLITSQASPLITSPSSLPPVLIPIPPPPAPLPSSSLLPRKDEYRPWTPESASLSLQGEGRCAQSEAVDQWLPNLLRSVEHMIADDKLFSKILTENAVSRRFGSCGSGVVKISIEQYPFMETSVIV